jgi:pilus assembly protein FimV
MPFVAEAAGLGRLTVHSGLGEPFSAEIELSAGKDELSSLTARIAPTDIYAEHGVERTSALGTIRVEVAKRKDGSALLRLSSAQPVDDPFLDMLIQVDWPTGRLLREYTALLDPPGYQDKASAIDTAAPADSTAATREASKKNTDKSPTALARPAEATDGGKAETPSSHRTQPGDTLRSVARKLQVEDVSLEQMLVGLYRANRDAFMQQNMNQLKVGRILQTPQEETLQSISQQEAVKEVRLHAANWNAYRSTLANAAARTEPSAQAPAQQQTASGKITATTEDKATPPPAPGPRDVVKLSKSDVAAAKTGTGEAKGAADDQLKSLEEESTAQENAIQDVSERIAIFEKQIQDMQKLLVVQNQLLAELQKSGAAPAGTPAATAPEAAAPPVAEKKPKPAAKRVPPPEPEESAVSAILGSLQNNPLLLGAGGLLVLLGGGWLFVRNRRKKSLDSFEQGILSSSGLKADTVFGAAGAGEVDTGKTSFMTDFGQQAGGDMIDTSDVDPISEADVYMAYGRDAQAEEILKDAIAKEPRRYELHQKLLEIYAKHKNTVAFETLAGELYATLGATSPIWLGVAALGRTMEPENPMYAAGTSSATVEAASEAIVAEPAADSAGSEQDAHDDNSLDFDLGSLAAEEPAPEAASEPLPELTADEETVAELKVTEELPEEDAGLDFDFDLPEPPADGNAQLDAADLGMPAEAEAEPLPELPALEASEDTVAELELPADALAELEQPATEEPDAVAAAEDLSLDMPEFSTQPVDEDAAEPASPVMEVEEAVNLDDADFGFELPEMEVPAPPTAPASASSDELEAQIDALDAAFELPVEPSSASTQIEEMPVAEIEEPEEIVLESPAQEPTDSGLDFDFDLDMGETETVEEEAQDTAKPLPDLDLSSISLDIGESAAEDGEVAEEITLSGGESSDVDTKLDLVTAYMDMGDAEGARELLEEVLREGGPQQRERAQKLLDSLD